MKHLATAAFAAMALSLAPAVQAEETLIFATTNPERHPLVARFMVPWAEAINADGEGVIKIDVRHGPGLASFDNFYDRVIDDVVQVVWGMTPFNPGQFPRSLVATLPFMVETSEQGSVAVCKLYEAGAFGPDMQDIVPLFFLEFPQSFVSLNGHKVTSIEDVAGLKVIASTPAGAAVVSAHGGTPLSFALPEQYEVLQRGAADGNVMNGTGLPGFKLHEVLTDHYIVPLGGAAGMVFMAKDRFDALSDDAKAVLAKHSGCEQSRKAGQFADKWEAEAIGFLKSLPGHTVTYATPEEISALSAKMSAGIEAGFSQRVPGGAELITQFKQELAASK